MKKKKTKKEEAELLKIIHDYSRAWTLLYQYDQGTLKVPDSKPKKEKVLSKYELIRRTVDKMEKILGI